MSATTYIAGGVFLLAACLLVYAVLAPAEHANPRRLFFFRRRALVQNDVETSELFKATRALRALRRNSLVTKLEPVNAPLAVAPFRADADDGTEPEEVHTNESAAAAAVDPSHELVRSTLEDDIPHFEVVEAMEAPSVPPDSEVTIVTADSSESSEGSMDDATSPLVVSGKEADPVAEWGPVLVVETADAGSGVNSEDIIPIVGPNAGAIDEDPSALDPEPVVEDAEEDIVENVEPNPAVVATCIWPRLLGLDPGTLDTSERVGILRTLGVIAEDQCAPILFEALAQESEPLAREAALEAIRDAAIVDATEELEAILRSGREREKMLALEALAAIGAQNEVRLGLSDACVAVVTRAAELLRVAGVASVSASEPDADESPGGEDEVRHQDDVPLAEHEYSASV